MPSKAAYEQFVAKIRESLAQKLESASIEVKDLWLKGNGQAEKYQIEGVACRPITGQQVLFALTLTADIQATSSGDVAPAINRLYPQIVGYFYAESPEIIRI